MNIVNASIPLTAVSFDIASCSEPFAVMLQRNIVSRLKSMDRNHLQVPACRDVIADSQILFFMSPHFDQLLDMTDGRLEHNVTVGSTVHVPSSIKNSLNINS